MPYISVMFVGVFAGLQLGKMGMEKERLWGAENPDFLPAQVRDELLFSGKVAPIPTYSWTPFVRDEDRNLSQHPWYQPHGDQQEEFFMTKIGQGQGFLITKEDVEKLGKDPSKLVRIPDDWGYGDKVYPASFDISHQLHCIHSLQRAIHQKPHNATHLLDVIDTQHTDHCLWSMYDYMRCHGSLDVMNLKWVEGVPKPVQDLTLQRQCIDVQAILDFQENHDFGHDARIRYMVATEDDYIHPVSPMRKKVRDANLARQRKLLKGKDWLTERKKRFDRAMEEWRETGSIPQTDANVIWTGPGSLHYWHDDEE
ncbi:hypothetical protein COCC4DRAFT_154745 [Bipolaris maydis ATCC 48331]|uniref:Uncharacterized protein n=2 Tax=Cochliobolus heterostrophus TaxID=5016 RepID=M2TT21_COCH5|nr:uncharacterized protein COCC4DRAFT_154745 [Bipolaris maydis ATCC 48331]EMD84926.1 hypothetical protein COCHEDRAFT_1219742 [Bipolaris maydis C5]KAJ5025776.1 hypothetical protein J3E73DRAFT_371317 [Bipolaris maydis]ENH98853.1 hypothetical protein COCC4DRAFT_154745 [Bipolaris maydis ATCC 48331]KAJ5064389.1 hypothetical protein J3E74DRAFT_402834 [Bipolaris maydis]KAJ6196467.1 hypothetical protein J3E72DRAFT_419453 [Bipolaris maydis]